MPAHQNRVAERSHGRRNGAAGQPLGSYKCYHVRFAGRPLQARVVAYADVISSERAYVVQLEAFGA